ncbi:hypothetical protein BG003_000815, partial [Podila horticola]
MAPLKSFLLASSLAVFQMVAAQLGGLGAGVGGGYGDALGYAAPTTVPVGPITIAAESDFVPINNVWPVVNVLPTEYNDYS